MKCKLMAILEDKICDLKVPSSAQCRMKKPLFWQLDLEFIATSQEKG